MNKQQKKVWTILSTPNDIDFKKFRELHDDYWLTKERELIPIEEMETSHILNCVNMLERAGQEKTKAYEGLLREINRRTNIKLEGWQYED